MTFCSRQKNWESLCRRGSVDREYVERVLRKENRIVGVISHVEEMQQEIDAHLIVSMDEDQGSTIRCSLD
jgi:exonuclease SbcC